MKTKHQKIEHFDAIAGQRRKWREKNRSYYEDLESFIAFLIPENVAVLEIGCGTGELLARLRPSRGVGIDFSRKMIEEARGVFSQEKFGGLEFRVGDAEGISFDETFDYVVLSDLIGELTDVWKAMRNLRKITDPQSKVVITTFNAFWEPLLRLGEAVGLKMPQDHQNWLSEGDIENLLTLNGFEIIKKGRRLLFPWKIPVLSWFLNRIAANLPLINNLGLVMYFVAQQKAGWEASAGEHSVTVVIPCRNERGNVRAAVERTPLMGRHTEILFVDGNSSDGTVEEIETVIREWGDKKDIRILHQVAAGSDDGAGHGKMLKLGKGDAVRKGFASATGDIVMVLDADLTVPPEELPMFYAALAEGAGRFINGSRLVYPMEKEAMRSLNKIGNKVFALLFSWVLAQRIKDTLCGTKALYKSDYANIAVNRHYFGDFDPFGDFDLL
ncbi:MAG: methyltransferase domain-containing protein, partial [Pseudomonadota bacterium]